MINNYWLQKNLYFLNFGSVREFQKYYGLEPVVWDDLINHIALKPDGELFNNLKQGYKNDKSLYYNQIEFEEIISALKNL